MPLHVWDRKKILAKAFKALDEERRKKQWAREDAEAERKAKNLDLFLMVLAVGFALWVGAQLFIPGFARVANAPIKDLFWKTAPEFQLEEGPK